MEKGMFIISLDFELFWGMLDVCELNDYRENIEGVENAIKKLLSLMKAYNIHSTWATVGFLFKDDIEEIKKYIPDSNYLPSYKNNKLSSYRYIFENKVISQNKQCFFAPNLIKEISMTEGQEVVCHTFSHYYCNEKGQNSEQFLKDLEACIKIAESDNYRLTSLVLPRNQINENYIKLLKTLNINCYRGAEVNWIHNIRVNIVKRLFRLIDTYLPISGNNCFIPQKEEVWNIHASKMYKPIIGNFRILEILKLHRIKSQMRYAAKNKLVYHLWWHPHNIGKNTELHLKQLEKLFLYYQKLDKKYGFDSLNMKECVFCFENQKNGKN